MTKAQKSSARKRSGKASKKTARKPIRKKAVKRRAKKVHRKIPGTRRKRTTARVWKEGDRSGVVLRGIRFPLALDRRINRAVRRLGTDRTKLVKEAMEVFLDKLERKTVRKARRTGRER